MGKDRIAGAAKQAKGATSDTHLDAEDLKALTATYKEIVQEQAGRDRPRGQALGAIRRIKFCALESVFVGTIRHPRLARSMARGQFCPGISLSLSNQGKQPFARIASHSLRASTRSSAT